MSLKTYYILKVYILTDKSGEWWESLNTDNNTRMFKSGTATFTKTKQFKSPDAAKKCGETLKLKRFKVVRLDPPPENSRTWQETLIYDVFPKDTLITKK